MFRNSKHRKYEYIASRFLAKGSNLTLLLVNVRQTSAHWLDANPSRLHNYDLCEIKLSLGSNLDQQCEKFVT